MSASESSTTEAGQGVDRSSTPMYGTVQVAVRFQRIIIVHAWNRGVGQLVELHSLLDRAHGQCPDGVLIPSELMTKRTRIFID